MILGDFDKTTFKQYIIVSPMQKETVRSSKLRILSEKFIIQSNLNRLNSSFCKNPHFVSIKGFCNTKIVSLANCEKLFLKNKSQLFQGGLRDPQPKIEIFLFINLDNIYFGKVNEFRDLVISYNKCNCENVEGGAESKPPHV